MSDDNISHLMLEQFRLIRTQIDRVYEEVRALKPPAIEAKAA